MATLILDGYNVIRALDRYRSAGDFSGARELLINDALKAAGWTGRQVIVVFDAPGSPEPGRMESRAGGAVRVLYTAPGESADDAIERLLLHIEGPVTVCSADFALQRAALARGAVRSVPREFEALLDELPAVVHAPNTPFRSRVSNRLSPGMLRDLEELRRRLE